jgi:hypothetical protein
MGREKRGNCRTKTSIDEAGKLRCLAEADGLGEERILRSGMITEPSDRSFCDQSPRGARTWKTDQEVPIIVPPLRG